MSLANYLTQFDGAPLIENDIPVTTILEYVVIVSQRTSHHFHDSSPDEIYTLRFGPDVWDLYMRLGGLFDGSVRLVYLLLVCLQ